MTKDGALTGTVTDIQRFSVHDGIGIRTIVFLKGCPLRCRWCHNPETNHVFRELAVYWDQCVGCFACRQVCPQGAIGEDLTLDRTRCTACGACARVCCTKARKLIGETRTVEDVLDEVERDAAFYRSSGGGMTLSGGEPTAQPAFAAALMRGAKERRIGTAIETCGFCRWELFEPILENTDMILYDIKHPDPERHREGTGVDNRLILENLRQIGRSGKRLVARIPLIPGFNDDPQTLEATARLAKEAGAWEIHVLPFHQIGQEKWHALDRDYDCEQMQMHPQENLRRAKTILETSGLPVNVGGYGEYQTNENAK